MKTLTNRYGTFRLDEDGSLVILTNTANLQLIENLAGKQFVSEVLRQTKEDLLRQQRNK